MTDRVAVSFLEGILYLGISMFVCVLLNILYTIDTYIVIYTSSLMRYSLDNDNFIK